MLKKIVFAVVIVFVIIIMAVIGFNAYTTINGSEKNHEPSISDQKQFKAIVTEKIVDAIWEPLNDELIHGFIKGDPSAMAYVSTTAEIVLAEVKRQNNMSASADVVNDDNARAVARVTWALIASRDSVAVLCSELYHRMLQNPDKVSKKAVVDLAEFVFLVAMASESIDYYNEENQAVRFILRRLDEKGDYGLWDKGVNPTPSDLKELSLFWMASCGNGIPKKWSGNTTFHVPFYKILRDAVKEDLVAPSYEKYGITISDDVTPSPTPVAEVPDVEKGSPESGEATPIPIPAKTKVTAPSFLGT